MTATTPDPQSIAQAVAYEVADEESQVGEFLGRHELEDNVSDFRFAANIPGYEDWQWSITLYHDEDRGLWTVNESSLVPGENSLMPPKWIPWKDRLLPTDLAVTDTLGTEKDDPRLEDGLDEHRLEADIAEAEAGDASPVDADASEPVAEDAASVEDADGEEKPAGDAAADAAARKDVVRDELEQTAGIAREFELSRRRVLTPLGRAQAAQRWYSGPHGPKSLSTKTADGMPCETCGFFVPLKGELNLLFGVCANKWSPDDGRVVSRDHGCGEHSEIEPPEPSSLWIQSKPAFDDLHIDIVRQAPREERGEVEAMESAEEPRFDGAGHYLGVQVGNVVLFRSQMPEQGR
ncbi:DUF3027 domain-containing protein [Bifidobacterium sp. 82T24]|uniref:DUF3027 domain-containing protein n=1 Tax=Bifidobacterium pluvialisilvae TaxID=2834436 RepID=UPI001C582016|nr:DUF3027 domain-containing protein [Bifidobacterium pluvialisilvae]MBW3087163.1 DUF3027 domain-containing protein [Bifidobacterium pluvialisilvae]